MEQLVARRDHNPKVVGSSPTPATIFYCYTFPYNFPALIICNQNYIFIVPPFLYFNLNLTC
jgi:hypothetical protein